VLLIEIGYNRTLMLELTDAPPLRVYDQEEELKAELGNVRDFLQIQSCLS